MSPVTTEDSGRGTLSVSAAPSARSGPTTSREQMSNLSRRESRKSSCEKNVCLGGEQKKWKRMQGHLLPLFFSMALQLGLICYVIALMIDTVGFSLLHLVTYTVFLLTSLFCTLEIIISRSKFWILLSVIDSACIATVSATLLIVDVKFGMERKDQKCIQRLSALFILTQLFHLLTVGHFYYVQYFGKKPEEEGTDKKPTVLA